uniref:Phytanoyl-CoA dioxygenase n=1 Tax=Hirondellea gigas TaxID=1518452 RepID=A0A6A7G1F4_9CRUS
MAAEEKDESGTLDEIQSGLLSQEQVSSYHKDGFITVDNVFPQSEVEKFRQVVDEFVMKSRTVTEHSDVFDLEPDHCAEFPRVRRLFNPARLHKVFDNAMRNPRLLDIVAQLIGPNIHTNGNKLNLKSPGFGSPVEWHQDWAFYPHTNDDLLAVGVAVDDMTLENGPLLVIPGSHKGKLYSHHQDGMFVGAISEEFEKKQAVPLTLKAGSISLHHTRLLHASSANRSANSRRFLLFQYCAGDAFPLYPPLSWETFARNQLRGKENNTPRLTNVPVRLPVPKHEGKQGIYELQTMLAKNTV